MTNEEFERFWEEGKRAEEERHKKFLEMYERLSDEEKAYWDERAENSRLWEDLSEEDI